MRYPVCTMYVTIVGHQEQEELYVGLLKTLLYSCCSQGFIKQMLPRQDVNIYATLFH